MLFSFEALFSNLAIHRMAISVFRKENFGQGNLVNFLQFAKFAKIFSLQNFVSYSIRGNHVSNYTYLGGGC